MPRTKETTTTENLEQLQAEKCISRIGGALKQDFDHLSNILYMINTEYFPLFYLMDFDKPENKDIVIDILLDNCLFHRARAEYIARGEENVASGKLRLERVLSERTLNKEYKTPEDREKAYKREAHRVLSRRFTEIEKTFRKESRIPLQGFYKYPLKVCREALTLSSEGIDIDGKKFIEIYQSYLEASKSQTGKLHQEAADAINRFFGGVLEVTETELKKFFILEDGIMKPNPKSINIEGYMRLGYRPKLATKKKK